MCRQCLDSEFMCKAMLCNHRRFKQGFWRNCLTVFDKKTVLGHANACFESFQLDSAFRAVSVVGYGHVCTIQLFDSIYDG